MQVSSFFENFQLSRKTVLGHWPAGAGPRDTSALAVEYWPPGRQNVWYENAHADGMIYLTRKASALGMENDLAKTSKFKRFRREKLPDYRDTLLGILGAIAIGGTVGHFSEWVQAHGKRQLEISAGFLIGGFLCIVVSPNRILVSIYAFSFVVVWGILGGIVQRTLSGRWLMIPCAIIAYLLLRWKGHLLR